MNFQLVSDPNMNVVLIIALGVIIAIPILLAIGRLLVVAVIGLLAAVASVIVIVPMVLAALAKEFCRGKHRPHRPS